MDHGSIRSVDIIGLQLNVPAKQDRQQLRNMAPESGKISIVVDEFHSEKVELVIATMGSFGFGNLLERMAPQVGLESSRQCSSK